MEHVNTILNRLELLKPLKDGEWQARCPAHNDRSPSMRVKLADEGKVLVHCFAGCIPSDITNALGLELKDLFPANDDFNKESYAKEKIKTKVRVQAEYDWIILQIAKADVKAGKSISPQDESLLREVLSRRAANG